MAKITLAGKEYETDNFDDAAKGHLRALQVCEAKMLDCKSELSILQTAHNAYAKALLEILDKDQAASSETKTESIGDELVNKGIMI